LSAVGTILPRVAVFALSAVVGAGAAGIGVSRLQDTGPRSTVGEAPAYMLAGVDTPAGPGPVVAFDETPVAPEPTPLPSVSTEDLDKIAAKLLGGGGGDGQGTEPAKFKDPTGFPRITPITQFDGGPFQGANCTLASGSMLARLAFGIVTNGSTLRTLQDDQDGGTGLNDLATALHRGYGVSAPTGLLRPQQLKDLLASGYGAVIQGIYGKLPTALRLQRSFTGGHAIYLDGYYPGNPRRGTPEAYYVIDPIGRPGSGYRGEWWPAKYVDEFGLAFGGGRIPAMWAYPPGGVPPTVVGPDVVSIPPDDNSPGGTPNPSATASPTASPTGSPTVSGEPTASPADPGSTFHIPFEPGEIDFGLPPPPAPPVPKSHVGDWNSLPAFDICVVLPSTPGCPTGIEAIFPGGEPPVLQLPAGPTINVLFVDSDRPNRAVVGFTVDPPSTADVKFWIQGASPGFVFHASAISTMELFGSTVTLAELDVAADTTYGFQAVAGDGISTSVSPVGSFTTGSGVVRYDVALGEVASPVIKAGEGLSPYAHIAAGAYLAPMVKLESLGGAACAEPADFGGVSYCLDLVDPGPAPATCTSANVDYELSGIEAEGVTVRAYPASSGVTPDGDMTIDGVLEAQGPPGAGTLSVGCLASGLTYSIVLDAVGDDRGALAAQTVTVP
jgi:hypothetical protein